MGGLLAATFLTLVVIPTIYISAAEWFERLKRKKDAPPPPVEISHKGEGAA
jgi:hypothetical protein